MDYTDDPCMNIFTVGQVARMEIILAESPRRASLTISPGAMDPVPVPNDLGIREIITPGTSICNNPVTPQIEVRNYGSNPVSSAQMQMSVNSIIIETTTFPLTLSPGDISLLSFSPLNFSPGSTQQVSFQVVQTNGGSDGFASNNQLSVSVSVPTTFSLPVAEFFSTTPTSWIISNPDGQTTWTNVVAPDNMQTNRAMSIEFYNYQNEGATDRLMTPAFTLTDPSNAQLRFDIAYAMYPGITGDGLKVYALRGCNPDLSQAILLYDKSGSSLATAPTTSNAFTPANATQWRKPEILSLGLLTGADAWQIAFIGRNGYGNNLYLDNAIITENEFNDITITGVASPGIVHCNPEPVVSFYVSNFGSTTVFSFDVSYAVNSGNNFTKHFSNAQLGVGQQKLFALDPVSLQDGYSTIVITVSNPNGVPDISNNNTISFTNIVDTSTDKPPLRMTFDNPSEVPWQIASPSDQLDWESISTSKQQSVTYKSFTNSRVGEESWLVSPILDFSLGTYSLFFDASYAQKIPADDRLRIVASTDCGLTYNLVIMDYAASIFSVAPKFTEWFPETDEDWKKQYVSLEALAGKQNVRIALVAHNNNGNNLFLDNIEFFAGDDPNPPLTTVPYQFYYSEQNSNSDLAITFSLSKKSDVRIQIYGMQGNVIQDTLLPGTLNQTYYYDFSEQSPGIYLFRLQIDNQLSTAKVFITH